MRVITDETAMVTRAIILGWQTSKLKAVGMWQLHQMEEYSIRSWWMQLQGNSTEIQRRLRPWLLNMLQSWWNMLAERHEQGSEQADKCKRCGSGWFSGRAELCNGGSCRRCCRIGGHRCCCYVDDCFCWNKQIVETNGGASVTGRMNQTADLLSRMATSGRWGQ